MFSLVIECHTTLMILYVFALKKFIMTYVHFLVKQGSTNRKAVRFQIVVFYEIKTLSVISKSNLTLHTCLLKRNKNILFYYDSGLDATFILLLLRKLPMRNII
jgi:hypothetical protein